MKNGVLLCRFIYQVKMLLYLNSFLYTIVLYFIKN